MKRLRELLDRMKEKFHSLDMKIARNLSKIYASLVGLFLFALMIGATYVWTSEEYGQAFGDVSLFIAVFAFLFLIIELYILHCVSRFRNLEAKAQYEILFKKSRNLGLISLGGYIFLMFQIGSLFILDKFNNINVISNPVLGRISSVIFLVPMFLIIISFPFFLVNISQKNTLAISLSLIRNLDGIIENPTISHKTEAYKMLFKNAANGTEYLLLKNIGTSRMNIYKPLNTIIMALNVGNEKQVNDAKNWISTLSEILEREENAETTRAIIDHLSSVKTSFPYFWKVQKDFGMTFLKRPFRFTDLFRGMERLGIVLGLIINIIFLLGLLYAFVILIQTVE